MYFEQQQTTPGIFDTGIWIHSLRWEDLEFAIEQATIGVPKGIFNPKGSCFLFLTENAVILNYLKTNDICITVDDFFHDSLFPVLPVECPRWAVAVELPGGVFITQHIVTHNCK